mmetsp:Transcript_5694/g.16033  ORF Transcript_5694/g.16033 Transcript_5694/m.16033 type:complete len:447 (-) Transcript_5694:167-1507(-)
MILSITWSATTETAAVITDLLDRLEFFSCIRSILDMIRTAIENNNWSIQEISFSVPTTELFGIVLLAIVTIYGGPLYQWMVTAVSEYRPRILLWRSEDPPYKPRNKTYSEDTTAAIYAGHRRNDDINLLSTPGLDGTEGSEEDYLFGNKPKEVLPLRHVNRLSHARPMCNYQKRGSSSKGKLQKQQSFSQKFDTIHEVPSFAEQWEDDDNNAESATSSINGKQSDATCSSWWDDDTTLPQSNESSQASNQSQHEILQRSSFSESSSVSLSPANRSKSVPAAELRTQLRRARNLPAPSLLKKQKYAVSTSALLKAVKQDRRSRTLAGRSCSLSKLDMLDAIRAAQEGYSHSGSHSTEPTERRQVEIEARQRRSSSVKKSQRHNTKSRSLPSFGEPFSKSQQSSGRQGSGAFRGEESSSRKRRAQSQTKHLAEDCRLLSRMFETLNDA